MNIAMRNAANLLVNRNRLTRDVFARGMPEPVIVQKRSEFSATLYDLLTAYAAERQRRSISSVRIENGQCGHCKMPGKYCFD